MCRFLKRSRYIVWAVFLLLPIGNLLAQQPSGKVVFSWFDDVYTYQLGASEPIQLTNGATTTETTWSPDGTKIAYISYQTNSSEIYVINADGTGQMRLTTNTLGEAQIAWSPDGSYIAFVSGRTGNSEVFVMNADGTNPINISNNTAFDFNPAWSSDGQQLLFSSERNGNLDIYAVNVDGTNLRQLTNTPESDKLPAWSSDGTKIAFVRFVDCERIFVANSDGSNPVQVSDKLCDLAQVEWLPGTNDLLYLVDSTLFRLNADLTVQQLVILPTFGDFVSQFDYWQPVVLPSTLTPTRSPTGTSTPNATAGNQTTVTNGRIAFVSERDGDPEIYTINPDGSDLRQLTFNDTGDYYPTWSPDGSRIAYEHEGDVYIMNADGSNSVKIENTFDARYLDWSPDGNSLAFSESEDIVVIDLSNLTTTRLTNTPEVLDESPTWSPDGTQIVFSSSGDNPVPFALDGVPTMEMYRINRDGSGLIELVNDVGSSLGSLNWASDNYLIYSVYSIPVDAIFSYGVDDSSKSRLSNPSNNAWGPSLSPDETKIAFLQDSGLAIMNRDGSNVTTILTIDGNITSLDWQPVLVVNPSSTPSPNPTTPTSG